MSRLRPCPRCGHPYEAASSRPSCLSCGWQKRDRRPDLNRTTHRRRARAAVDAHVARHGWVCPGYGRPAHPSRDLTADHPEAVALGGHPDQELSVLCRPCNGLKGDDERHMMRVR